MKPYRQQARTYRLQHRAHYRNGYLEYKVAQHQRQWRPSCQAWPGPYPAMLPRQPREFGDLAIPTQELVVDTTTTTTTTRTTASWWGWVASSEPAKCRTLATASTSSSAKVAEKTHLPSTPGALIVLDEWFARSGLTPRASLSYLKPIYSNKCYW